MYRVWGEESVPELGNGDGCIICDYTKKIIKFFFFFLNGDLDKNVAMKGMRNNQTLDVFCIES